MRVLIREAETVHTGMLPRQPTLRHGDEQHDRGIEPDAPVLGEHRQPDPVRAVLGNQPSNVGAIEGQVQIGQAVHAPLRVQPSEVVYALSLEPRGIPVVPEGPYDGGNHAPLSLPSGVLVEDLPTRRPGRPGHPGVSPGSPSIAQSGPWSRGPR